MSTAHIYIYGEIGWTQAKSAKEWGEVNLTDVRDQYEAQKDCDDIMVHIHSPGGVVTEGYAIHDFIRSKKKPITTSIEGMCASIATVIALSGDTRTMTSNSEFMIHLPSGISFGNSEDMDKASKSLKQIEENAANFYAAKTNLTADQALEMMRAETFMTAEKALEHGFITEIASTMKAVAKFDTQNLKNEDMSKMNKKEAEKEMDGWFAKMKKNIFGEQPKMKMVIAADGTTEIDFTELEDDDTPAVDDVATVDGSPAEGEHLMPSGETYVFAAGVLTEIKPSEEGDDDGDDTAEEMAQLKTEIAEMKAKAEKDAKAIKALEKSNAEMKASQEKQKESFEQEFKAFKASMSSNFENEEGDGNDKKPGTGKKTRKVFEK